MSLLHGAYQCGVTRHTVVLQPVVIEPFGNLLKTMKNLQLSTMMQCVSKILW